ncbi:MAG: nickel pincer cofactor biosynthesis protein LarC [Acidimicrobiales bacterium]
MTTQAWFHCFSGIAGDMALGSLIDAGADIAEIKALLARLGLNGWGLEVEPVMRSGLAATLARIEVVDDQVVRTHAHIVDLIHQAQLPPRVTERSLGIFAALAEVEANLHRRTVATVSFHEVGGHDAVIDIVGTCAALEVLGVDRVASSPIATGTGMIRSAHGYLPNPAPAVIRLLEHIPIYGRDLTMELTTPTGAALISVLAEDFGPMPAMVVRSSGFGAGSRDLEDIPNCTQAVIGVLDNSIRPDAPRSVDAQGGELGTDEHGVSLHGPNESEVTVLETNLDDVTGETLAHAMNELMAAGALDCWVTPIVMKKGRPAHLLSVLCQPSDQAGLAGIICAETATLGIRGQTWQRWTAPRSVKEVDVSGWPVRVKASPYGVKAEYEDAAAAARALELPLRRVSRRAENQHPDADGSPTRD